jgi:hypothetical protein
MLASLKTVRRLVVTAGLVILPVAVAFAQAPQIAAPDYPGSLTPQWGGFEGCYRINQDLYGPYRMSFCLDQHGGGSYLVTGSGLYCNGRLNWAEGRGEARVDIHYSWCGRGVGWSADTMVCVPQQPRWKAPQPLPIPGPWNGPNARIAIPEQPTSQDLRCGYYPGVHGYQPVSVIAEKANRY